MKHTLRALSALKTPEEFAQKGFPSSLPLIALVHIDAPENNAYQTEFQDVQDVGLPYVLIYTLEQFLDELNLDELNMDEYWAFHIDTENWRFLN
tara:strand:- start:1415 stop:1696 length:282 start_codon:yes stop_codon:yes gene_type:complete